MSKLSHVGLLHRSEVLAIFALQTPLLHTGVRTAWFPRITSEGIAQKNLRSSEWLCRREALIAVSPALLACPSNLPKSVVKETISTFALECSRPLKHRVGFQLCCGLCDWQYKAERKACCNIDNIHPTSRKNVLAACELCPFSSQDYLQMQAWKNRTVCRSTTDCRRYTSGPDKSLLSFWTFWWRPTM